MFLPMLDSTPEQWPLDEGDDAARLLTWRGTGGGAAASLEDTLIATLRFVAGAVPPPTCQVLDGCFPSSRGHSRLCAEAMGLETSLCHVALCHALGGALCAGACSIAGAGRRADNVFLGDLALLPELGVLLWPRLAGAYIQRYLAPLLPSGNSDMAAFDQVAPAFMSVFPDIVTHAHIFGG